MVEMFIEVCWSLFFEIALRLPGMLILWLVGNERDKSNDDAVVLFSLLFWGLAALAGVMVWAIVA